MTGVTLHNGDSLQVDQELSPSEGGETSSSVRSAQSLSTYKRLVMLAGFIGTYLTWAIFIFVRASARSHATCLHSSDVCAARVFRQTYGSLIAKLLGDQAQSEFARSWGISYGMNAATEWKDIVVEALKATVILIILERS